MSTFDAAAATAAMRRHPAFAPVVEAAGPVALGRPAPSHYAALVRSIVFQQLAGQAAATIHGRVAAVVGDEVVPERMDAADDGDLRTAGLSAAKLAAIRDLTRRVLDGDLDLAAVATLDDARVVSTLSQVRGIGRWTAEMFLIFQLQRPDVWPVTDLGVRRGYGLLHGMDEAPTPEELARLGDELRPWRTAAAWYCWRAVDVVPPSA